MKYWILTILFIVIAIILISAFKPPENVSVTPVKTEKLSNESHIYSSWETMEFDKCVAAWLIIRFIDAKAEFVLYPSGTEIEQGIAFDVPGAPWSRKHRKSTAGCILESMTNADPAVKKMVFMAEQIELNFWQLDRFPEVQKEFHAFREATQDIQDPLECLKKGIRYFDKLYQQLRTEQTSE